MTEAWFRNPDGYIRELVEAGEYLIAWDRGRLVKRKIDPIKHADVYFGKTYPWRALAIGQQGTVEYRTGDSAYKPTAVYPTWNYGEDQELLEEIVEFPVGEDEEICNDKSIAGDELPVFGQEHRVVITGIPPVGSGPGRKFIAYLKMLQEDNPDCIIHVHGLYSFRVSFGMGFGAADVDPKTDAQKGNVMLPSGKKVLYERTKVTPKWVSMLGFKPVDLAKPRNRCIYNIKSAVWAGANFQELFNIPAKDTGAEIDYKSPSKDFKPVETKSPFTGGPQKAQPGDKFACDTCSLQLKCSHYRQGAVCSLPDAEPKALASYFKSRDSDQIIEGLSTLVAANTRRLERGMQQETAIGDVDKEVTQMIGQIFDQGTKLAKLIDPDLRGGAKVSVNVGGNAAVIANASPRQMVSSVIRELEERGFKREEITPEMVKSLLAGMQSPDEAESSMENAPRVIEQ